MENQNHNGGDNGNNGGDNGKDSVDIIIIQEASLSRYAFIPSFILQKEGIDILIFPNQQECRDFVNMRRGVIEQGNCLTELSGPDFHNWMEGIQVLALIHGVNCLTRNQRALLLAADTVLHYGNLEPTPLQNAIAEGCNRAVQQKVAGLCRGGMPQERAEELVVEVGLGNDWQIAIATLPTASFPEGVIGQMETIFSASLAASLEEHL